MYISIAIAVYDIRVPSHASECVFQGNRDLRWLSSAVSYMEAAVSAIPLPARSGFVGNVVLLAFKCENWCCTVYVLRFFARPSLDF